MSLRFTRASKPRPLTLFYVADLHGSEKCFRKFLAAARVYEADVIILGGDITGKAFVPLVEQGDGSFEATHLGSLEIVRGEQAIADLESRIRFNGFYPFRATRERMAELAVDPPGREAYFSELMASEVRRWVSIAEERLRDSRAMCLIMPGNDDEPRVGDLLRTSERVVNPEGEIVEVGGVQFVSYGYSNITPWHSPRELEEDELETRLEEAVAAADSSKPTVFNFHVPPYDTGIDEAPEIRADFSLVGGSNARMVPVGSHAVRRVIERHQPLLGLHGHIHEGRGSARLGRTVVVNPGSEYNTGTLRGALIKVEGDRTNIQFVSA